MTALTASQAFAAALQHHKAGRLSEAESLYRQVLAAHPHHADALHFFGVISHEVGRNELAVELIGRSLALSPNNAAAHFSRGSVYHSMGRIDEAMGEYRRALDLQPDLAEAHNNLGNALRERGQFEEAVAAFRRALQLKPNLPEVWNNLGIALSRRGQLDEAVASFHRALQLKPDFAEASNNLGIALTRQRRFDEAMAAYHRAIQLNPNYAEAWYTLGDALREACQLQEAMAAYRRALELNPGFIEAHSSLLQTALYVPGFDRRNLEVERNRWTQQHAQPLPRHIHPHNIRNPARTLRIGYVSPDFQDNVIGRYLLPLFRCHDRQQFEILCYSGVVQPDGLTEEFRQHSGEWRTTVDLADEVLAKMIRHDEVDILVDLTLHAPRNRLLVFARQPAPVQVSFAGYPASTGLEAIGYRISDRYLESEREDRGSKIEPELRSSSPDLRPAERVFLLDSFWCFDPCGIVLPINALPGGAEGRVTFGCLNSVWKINERHLTLWAQILRETGDSRLMLLSASDNHRQRTLDFLKQSGVDPQRVEFAEPRPRAAYLELYHRLDIALDPFPYNGHSTSLDALWMGVPVVSLVGEQSVSRAGLSQLSNLGLPELAAFSEEDYVRIAVDLAMDLPRLAELRATLRMRMEASPLMDAPRFARNVETAYRTMWREWCEER